MIFNIGMIILLQQPCTVLAV